MPAVHRTRATLSVVSSDLDPADVTRVLGCPPTASHRRGDRVTAKSGPRTQGAWLLEAADQAPGNLDAQINEILANTTTDLELWSQLRNQHDVYLFCGLFLQDPNEMLSIDPIQLHALGVRGVRIVFDIYDRS